MIRLVTIGHGIATGNIFKHNFDKIKIGLSRNETDKRVNEKSYTRQHNLTIWYHISTIFSMPPKIRELIKKLKKAGFENRGGKGSHRNFIHPRGIAITISGKTGDDAKKYQENEVKRKISESTK